jgi:phage tail sheath protein FI
MATYLWPGVYVEEVPSAVKPIAGVGTSTAGFVGIVADDVAMPALPSGSGNYTLTPALSPQPLNNWLDFEQKFGQIQAGNQYLAQAVYGFFNNGGTRCWVTRVASIDNASDAVDTFEPIDEIAIVAAPMPPDTDQAKVLNPLQVKLISHCALLENRVAILDSARDVTNDNLVISTDDSGIWKPSDASNKGYGAFYFPWIQVADPLQPGGARISVPPSGHLAGIYARSDAQRGVYKAPANEGIMGALGVQYRVSKILQGSLNPDGVNVIRPFDGTVKVWGARTLADDPEWTYVSTRRLVNFLRESIEGGTRWVVFEPNTSALWAKIRRNVNAFLRTVWASGALFGTKPEEAFYVRCDETTNPPEVRDLGQVVTEIGVAVVKPAEFVVFRLSQWAGPGE